MSPRPASSRMRRALGAVRSRPLLPPTAVTASSDSSGLAVASSRAMASSMPGSQSITRRVAAMPRLYLGPPMNDRSDPAPARDRFALPPEAYLAGNSLGLQPLAARDAIARRIDESATLAVEGWWAAG